MPELLKRIAFEVAGNPDERTFTLSSGSNDGHYLSLRPLVKPRTPEGKEFPFEWAFAGTNKDITVTPIEGSENTVKQDFNFWIDINAYLNVPNTHRGVVNTVWTTWDSGCIKEAGEVFPFGKDKQAVPFIELWQPIDANKEDLVIVQESNKTLKSIVLKIDDSEYSGLVIVVGKWVQGILIKKSDGTKKGLNFMRLQEASNGSYKSLIEYGIDSSKFPKKFDSLEKDAVLSVAGLNWTVIEATY
ncbi:Hri1p NDAI_0D00750 [Naumovozyma dairenensis CBS 421]|uniref:Protein HRI1 n=1 Tax=Naumovozyma dairenensis (strain ATCC 10597 / BCRC 20456 / CBS 421 / NBRC 0211 / NRRL Y-12639) TaxID=1071378 RepID=G0W9C8_NAUDC|nr:hypothetical protein NDAI_0D00750 [Naumovozyma dairenensis CBS 421]CCD24389.1 hypothetical protein NDAI_0D00750 [Naumovozyma dairenensis CBS 421]